MTRLLDRLPFRAQPQVLPRFTNRKTAEVIAEQTGEDPSKILARLDRDRVKRQGKRALKAGRNPFGSLEYAVDYAVSKLGAARVASILKVNEWSLRKGTDPNQPDRRLPDFGIRDLLRLVKVLKDEGHAEHFSAVIEDTGDAAAAVEHLPTLHHAVTLSCITHGDMARAIAEAAEEGITPAEAASILDAIARHQEATRLLQSHVLAVANVKESAS